MKYKLSFDESYKLFIRFLKENNCYHSFMLCFKYRNFEPLTRDMFLYLDKVYTLDEYCVKIFAHYESLKEIFTLAFNWSETGTFIHKKQMREAGSYWYDLTLLWERYLRAYENTKRN